MIADRISSLKEVAEVVRREGEIRYALRDFLDGFYAEPTADKLLEEPTWLTEALSDGGVADAYLAATCDHLCRQYHLPRPAWIKSGRRILRIPFFAAKSHGLRMIYLQESPTAFRQRNLFVSANALYRA